MAQAAAANPQAELNKILAGLEKKYGSGFIHDGSTTDKVNHLPFLEPNLNYATEGGAPFGRFSAFYGDESTGKDLDLNTPIPTPSGWTTMGQIEVGDLVFNELGQPTRVTYTSPVFTTNPCYRVEFDDGSHIIAGAEHQWLTSTYLSRQAATRVERRALVPASSDGRGKWQKPQDLYSIVTTEQIAESVTWGKQKHHNHAIDNPQPLDLPHADLPIDPYTLGVWLGDGSSRTGEYTKPDEEIAWQICSAGYEVTAQPSSQKNGRCQCWTVRGLVSQLREASLLNNKHIPAEYLRASASQRLALLQGLLDTDGHADEQGRVEFCNTNKKIVDGFYELACSLGIKARVTEGVATLYGREIGPKWRVCFTTEIEVFRLPRKLERQRLSFGARGRARMWRKIVSCERVETVPTRCIAVDSPSHLFLAGRQMVVTHNTRVAYELIAQLQNLPGSAEVILIPRIAYHSALSDDASLGDDLRRRHTRVAELLQVELNWLRETFPDGGEAVFYNAEQQYDPIYARKIGIDTDRLKIIESTTIEEIVEAMQALYPHYAMHVVDSTSSASSLLQQKQEVGKSLMGTDARQWKASLRSSMPFFDPSRNMGILIHQMSTNIRTGGAQAASTRYLRHTSSCSIKFSRGKFLWRKDGVLVEDKPTGADEQSLAGIAEPDGVEVFAKIEKSRTCRPFRAAGMQFDYRRLHFVTAHELASSALYFGIAKKSGSWFKIEGEENNLGQGLKALYARLADDEELRSSVMVRLLDYTGED